MLVALDIPADPAALQLVVDLAAPGGWKVLLLHVTAPATGNAPSLPESDGTTGLDGVRDWFAEQGVSAQAQIIDGPIIDTVLRTARSIDAAMIVLVATQRRRANKPTLGSVSGALLKVTERPVLVLPTSVAADDGAGFSAALDRLIGVIDHDESPTEFGDLRSAAEHQLEDPSSDDGRENLGQRLRQSLEQFETDHPSFTRAVNDVAYYLSGLGI